jgi:hypothetical protein
MTSIAGESSVTRFGAGRVNVQTPERAGENELNGWYSRMGKLHRLVRAWGTYWSRRPDRVASLSLVGPARSRLLHLGQYRERRWRCYHQQHTQVGKNGKERR